MACAAFPDPPVTVGWVYLLGNGQSVHGLGLGSAALLLSLGPVGLDNPRKSQFTDPLRPFLFLSGEWRCPVWPLQGVAEPAANKMARIQPGGELVPSQKERILVQGQTVTT